MSAVSPTPEIVAKPWGWEYCAFDNGAAAIWILHIARGRQTSRHCHPQKRTRLVLLQGEARYNGRDLRPLEVVDIPKGVYHQTEVAADTLPASENGAFVMEIEEPSLKADIVREDDAYGRAGFPIETQTIPVHTEMLQLTTKGQSLMGYRFKLESTLGGPFADLMLEVGGVQLGIYRETKVRVADWISDFVRSKGVEHVFGVVGGGAMHLNDAFRHIFVPTHHEQAAAMAAEAYARLHGFGCCLVTTGPGSTNAITGLACAWVDSIPLMVISGQVTTQQLRDRTERQMGVQGLDIVPMVRSITKYARTLKRVASVEPSFEFAYIQATRYPCGPVWLDVPLDIQGAYL